MRTNAAVAKRAIAKRMQIRDEKEVEDTYQLLKSFIQVKPYPTPPTTAPAGSEKMRRRK
jgi:hypothetical protein